MKQLFINGDATTIFFNSSVSLERILNWVEDEINFNISNNIFNLSEPQTCGADIEEGVITIWGDEDSLTLTIEEITPLF